VDFVDKICRGICLSLFLFGLFGFRGVLVDLDHIIRPLQMGLPITLENVATYGTRIFHFPLLLADSIIVCFLGACLGGLLFDTIAERAGCYKEQVNGIEG
jgi:hypothetical protein